MGKDSNIKSIEDFINEIHEDSHDYINEIAKNMAKIIADELTETTESAIEQFYKDYDPEEQTPIYYYRHWNFNKSFKRYYSDHKPKYVGGVELKMFDLPNVYTGTNSDPINVFWRVYSGYHGIASFQSPNKSTFERKASFNGVDVPSPVSPRTTIHRNVPIMNPSPLDLIKSNYNYIINHLKEYEDKAAEIAVKSGKYKRFK